MRYNKLLTEYVPFEIEVDFVAGRHLSFETHKLVSFFFDL